MSNPYAATQRAYDTVATDYARLLEDDLATNIWDRAVLGVFAEHIAAAGGGPVLDLGCGPGRITGYLHDLGMQVSGADLSSAMVAEASRRFPTVDFAVGRLDTPNAERGSLAGLLAWYSLIHVPPQHLRTTMQAIAEVLRPGGYLQLAFQVGDGYRRITHAYGHDLDLDAWSFDPDHINTELEHIGLDVLALTRRAPQESERSHQAFVLARKP